MTVYQQSESTLFRLAKALPALDPADTGAALKALVDNGLDTLPFPGQGKTVERWRCLARVAAHDLALLKLYEGHTDALAILDELGGTGHVSPKLRWGVWAAEPPQARLQLSRVAGDTVRLNGRKSWCSGAHTLTHSLVTCWEGTEGPYLAAVPLDGSGIAVTDDGWCAVGMAATRSVDVTFDQVEAVIVGSRAAYLERPGFRAGGIGIAACWYGAAEAIAAPLQQRVDLRGDPLDAFQLGLVDVALAGARQLLLQAAADIDRDLRNCSVTMALRTRLAVEQAAEITLRHVGRALGAAPFCRDKDFARRAADLTVFLRQSHAEKDLAVLGRAVAAEVAPWPL